MSLKAFHIFFISISVLLAVGMGIMTLRTFLETHEMAQLGWCLLSFAAAIVLIIYGLRIRKKLENVGLMLAGFCLIFFPRAAWACSVCMGDPDAPQTHGMNMAILFMLGVVATLLGSFAVFFVHLRTRAKLAASENLNSHGRIGRGERL